MRTRLAISVSFLIGIANISTAHADTQTIYVSTPTALVDAFNTANQNPSTFYYVELSPGTYNMTSTLTLTTGQMQLDGAWTLADAQSYVLDWGMNASNAHGSGQDHRGIEVNGGFLLSGGFVLRNAAADSTASGTGHGGILEIQSGYVWIDTAVITGGWANSWGAGISVSGASSWLDLNGVVVSNNKNSQDTATDPVAAYGSTGCGGFNNFGGGLAVTAGAGATVTNSSIIRNRACAAGGIYFGSGGSLQVINSTIDGNVSGDFAAGVYLSGAGTVSLSFSTIHNNTTGYDGTHLATNHGGGLDLNGFTGSLTMAGNTIKANHLYYKRQSFPKVLDNDSDATRDCSLEGSAPAGTIALNILGVRGGSSSDGSCFSVFPVGGSPTAPSPDNLLPLSSDLMPVDRPNPSFLSDYYSPDNDAPIFCPGNDQLGAARSSQWLCRMGAIEPYN